MPLNNDNQYKGALDADILFYRQQAHKKFEQDLTNKKIVTIEPLLAQAKLLRDKIRNFERHFYNYWNDRTVPEETTSLIKELTPLQSGIRDAANEYFLEQETHLTLITECIKNLTDLSENLYLLSRECFNQFVRPLRDNFLQLQDSLEAEHNQLKTENNSQNTMYTSCKK